MKIDVDLDKIKTAEELEAWMEIFSNLRYYAFLHKFLVENPCNKRIMGRIEEYFESTKREILDLSKQSGVSDKIEIVEWVSD
jgi:hypothetical protein